MSGKFDALGKGAATFVGMWFGLALLGQALRAKGTFTTGEARLCAFFTAVALICMWMMWTMTWLSQVNPILYPFEEAHGEEHAEDDHH